MNKRRKEAVMNPVKTKMAEENSEAIQRLKEAQAAVILEHPENTLAKILLGRIKEYGVPYTEGLDKAIESSVEEYKQKREWAIEVKNNQYIREHIK